jgi:iron complex outermembrane recepter protein
MGPHSIRAAAASLFAASLSISTARADARVEEVVVSAPRADTIGLGDMFSTASRLNVSALDLPASVSRVDEQSMQTKAQTTVTEALNGTTGLVGYARAGAAGVYSWRGFTENAVATLYDGIRVQGSTVTTRQYDTFAFDRIEVLRGPASALHGEGALSGAVNYVRKQPQRVDGLTTQFLAAAGSYDSWRLGLAANAALASNLHARADVVRQEFGTQVHGNENELTHAAISALWDLSPQISMLFQMDHLDARSEDAYWGTPVIDGRVAFELRRVNYNNATDNRYRDEVTWLKWQTEWLIQEGLRLRNQAYRYDADRDWRNIGRFLWTAATATAPATVGRTFWEDLAYRHELYGDRAELSIDGTIGGRRNMLTAGFDVSRTSFASPRNYSAPFGLRQQVDPWQPSPVDFFTFGRPRLRARETDVEQWAAFIEERIELTDRFAAQALLRHDHMDVDFARYDVSPAQFYRAAYEPTTWSVGVTFKPLAQATIYAQYGTSATPADSLLVIADPVTAAFDLTQGRGFEVGFKQVAYGGRIEWTLALYDLQQRNIPSAHPDNLSLTRLIGEQSSRGVETALAWRPVPALLIEANVAWLDAQYDTFREGAADRSGNRPPNVPERVANFDIDYVFAGDWSVGASLRYVGDFAANTSNSIVFPSYTLADARVRYALSPAADVSLLVYNLFDERYAAWATAAGGQDVMANIGPPRTAGVQLQMRF